MAAFLSNLRNVVIAGFVLAAVILVIHVLKGGAPAGDVFALSLDSTFWQFIVRWLHIISGVMWIGLLWYFNFVSTPTTPKIRKSCVPRSASSSHRLRFSGSAGARWARSCSESYWLP